MASYKHKAIQKTITPEDYPANPSFAEFVAWYEWFINRSQRTGIGPAKDHSPVIGYDQHKIRRIKRKFLCYGN